MKHIRTLLAALLLAAVPVAQGAAPGRIEQGNLILDGIPALDVATPRLAPWLEPRGNSFVDWLADGSLVITAQAGNTAQLKRIRTPLGTAEPLTSEAEPVLQAVAHPYDSNSLLFRVDRSGDGNHQIWAVDLAAQGKRLLTDGKSRNGAPAFAHDGKRIAFTSNLRDGFSHDIYQRDIGGDAAPQLLLAGSSDPLQIEDWSLDDRRIAVIRNAAAAGSQLLIVEVASGLTTRIEPAPSYAGPSVRVRQARFARDGRGLFFISDRGSEFSTLQYIELAAMQVRTLTPDTSWDIERFELSQDGRFLAYTRNEAGTDRLVLHDLSLKADLLSPPLPAGAVVSRIGFDRSSRQLAVSLSTSQSPPEVFVVRIELAADLRSVPTATLARWTQADIAPLAPALPVLAQRVQFPTWDRDGTRLRQLPAFIYRPRTPGPHPVLIDMHSGRESQYRPGWDAFIQYLVNELGYVVVAPNVRGSSGYGRDFVLLGSGALRDDAVRDIGALLVWIGLQPDMDRTRMAVIGGSMALAALVNYGDKLQGGIYEAGVSSPLNNVVAINRPLLILRGLNDAGVSPTESEQMMAVLRSRGSEVWYLAAKDEGRGFLKKANSDLRFAAQLAFLQQLTTR